MTETLTALSACLCGLFPGWKTLSSFPAFFKIIVEFLSYVLKFLLAVLVSITWETYFGFFLPKRTCFIFWLMHFGVIGLGSTNLVVLTPMIGIGHGVAEGYLQARFPGGVEYPEGLSRVGRLAGFILLVKTDPLAL